MLRLAVLAPLLSPDPLVKAELTLGIDSISMVVNAQVIPEPTGIPGRPPRPVLVSPKHLKRRNLRSREGLGALVHALAHIELNAIDLALDIVWRFEGMPDDFYTQWVIVAKEEATHFQMLRNHLVTIGYDYGDFPAHNALWEMAERTKGDLLARLAIVPRTLEARGLDASPQIRDKLTAAGDERAASIVNLILEEEIRHVRVGDYWFKHLCAQRDLSPLPTYQNLINAYRMPKLRQPLNRVARQAAGFSLEELAMLVNPTS